MAVDPAWLQQQRLMNQRKHGLAGLGATPAEIVAQYRARQAPPPGAAGAPSEVATGLMKAAKVIAGLGVAALAVATVASFWPTRREAR